MEIELNDLLEQLQGRWKLENDEHSLEINGNELTVVTDSKSVQTSFELIRNLQLKNWQIKATKHVSWLRTFVVQVTPDSFMLYDFNPTVNMAMGARSKLLNPTRVFRYTRVAVLAVP